MILATTLHQRRKGTEGKKSKEEANNKEIREYR
jgi:hypothetical protein